MQRLNPETENFVENNKKEICMNENSKNENSDKKKELENIANWENSKELHQPIPLKDIKIPNRVIFIEIPSGKAFFDCHPAEARMAMAQIWSCRQFGLYSEGKREAEIFRQIATTSKKPKLEIFCIGDALSIAGLNQMFVEIENHDYKVEAIFMNPIRYADIRNWGKTLYDESSEEEEACTGLVGKIWKAGIYIDNKIRKDTISLVGTKENCNGNNEFLVKRFKIVVSHIK